MKSTPLLIALPFLLAAGLQALAPDLFFLSLDECGAVVRSIEIR